MLHKYIPDPYHVLSYQPVELNEDLTYEEDPVEILDKKERVLRTKRIQLVKGLRRPRLYTRKARPIELLFSGVFPLGPLDPADDKRGLIGRQTRRNINKDLIGRLTRRNINRGLIGCWTWQNISRGMIGRWTSGI
ncbi:hypothetical protein CRG98_013919 [Punica granatum]|uniref:Uncharacterized protein n=1 Tax=Punica granatum TaxID=22663 RepID=A0A2I0KAY4_PUNGR|nr:hypothetical protein CRG98_013919 [Punica granatum]